MHCFASKVSKVDPYVTPVPDRRFFVDRTAVLAEDLSADAAEIPTASDLSQWPGSPVAKQKVWEGGVQKHREVVIDDEIIRYESIGPEGKWKHVRGLPARGLANERGPLTRDKTNCRHYAVDGCINGYIIDQETDLLDEVDGPAGRGFQHVRFRYGLFRRLRGRGPAAFRLLRGPTSRPCAWASFRKRPLIHKGGGFHHNLWHSPSPAAPRSTSIPARTWPIFGPGGTSRPMAHVQGPTSDRTGEAGSVACQGRAWIPGELGWFGINPADRRV